MRFYSQGYESTLDLPLKTFWMMSNNINRISAEEDIRRLSTLAGAASSKGFEQTNEALKREMGDVLKRSANAEARAGINTLKEIAGKQLANR